MKKIGIVLSQVPGYSETFFNNKISGLIKDGNRVSLFVQAGSGNMTTAYPIFRAPNLSGSTISRAFNSFFALLNLFFFSFKPAYLFWQLEKTSGSSFAKIIKRLIINSHILNQKLDWLHFGYATMGLEREWVGKAIGARVAVSFRGYDISMYPLKNPGCYNQLWKNIDKVHTISNALLNEAYLLGLPKTMETVKITPAIEVENFVHSRGRFFENNTLRILTVGRLHWIKGLEYTLEALAQLKKQGYSIHYTMVGTGIEYERLVYAAYQLGLAQEVHFMGKLPHAQIPQLMATHDVYIQYSVHEGFCNAVLEAQAADMLCVVSDAEGLSENVLHNQTGWVVPKRNSPLLAIQIEAIYHLSHQNLMEITSNAVSRVKSNFNLEKQHSEFSRFYQA
ncbi:MAG: glycosyltransferase family 4 protein [Bacteroidetes bacterium]|nr:glycosyltransferase family 4 protein [Bacteroidota bacterium]